MTPQSDDADELNRLRNAIDRIAAMIATRNSKPYDSAMNAGLLGLIGEIAREAKGSPR